MSKINCVLDACSIINLISIDEDDFLIKKLFKCLKLSICEKVLKEVKCNIFKKENLQTKKKEVDTLLGQLYHYVVSDSTLEKDCGKDFFERIHKIANYKKENGEFYSSALALYLSQYEEIKLFFHTDDSPAKNEFQDFFITHQIGGIEDTADLILLIYRLDDKFLNKELIKFLDSLFAEYAREVAACLKELREISSFVNSNAKFRKKGNLKNLIHKLIIKLESHDFSHIHELKRDLLEVNDPILKGFVQKYEAVFMLDPSSQSKNNFLNKIRTLQKKAKKENIYKII
ncbi:MAG: hypothetical protein KDC34_13905 [Saprospiraceae bacterium]|nr:hypothetical protein [Saprospiraceae bacterium]